MEKWRRKREYKWRIFSYTSQYSAIGRQIVHIIMWGHISSLLSSLLASQVVADNVLGLPKYLPSRAAWWLGVFARVRRVNPYIHSCFGKRWDGDCCP